MEPKKKTGLLGVLGILLLLSLLLMPFLLASGGVQEILAQAKGWVLSFGIFAPVALVLLMLAAVVVGPVPNSLAVILAGSLYGPVLGLLLSMLGNLLGALLAFQVARWLGRKPLENWIGETPEWDEFLEKNGFWAVLVLRLLPNVSFDLVSYLAGLTKMKKRIFLVATLFGSFPGTLGFVLLGENLLNPNLVWIFYAGFLFVLVAVGGGWLLRKKFGKKKEGKPEGAGRK